jgi:hypothetical protein
MRPCGIVKRPNNNTYSRDKLIALLLSKIEKGEVNMTQAKARSLKLKELCDTLGLTLGLTEGQEVPVRASPVRASPVRASPVRASPVRASPKEIPARVSPKEVPVEEKKESDNVPRTVRVFPSLYASDKGGKMRVWNASVALSESGVPLSVISYGQEGGKMQTASREYTSGKNTGKKNETTPLEQCTQETERKWKDKKEKDGYVEQPLEEKKESPKTTPKSPTRMLNVKKGPFYPMLAHTYEPDKEKQKIVYPCLVQPKLDGLRCITYISEGKIVFQSRTAGTFDSMSHLIPSLRPLAFSLEEGEGHWWLRNHLCGLA